MDIDARYEFLEKVGAGSFATVYRARDLELGREVAIKQIHEQFLDDPEQLERYWTEAQLLASLAHPNIVTIYDIYRDRGWLILELMQSNLAERMAGRQMDLRALRTTIAHSLRALKYLHSRGVIHGDIKPGNMMIDARRRVKLGDFGLARRVSNEEGSLVKGTTKYMAPEVVSEEFGDVAPASDLYSLGFASYELMCGPNFDSLFPGLSAFGRDKQLAWMMWHAAADRKLPEINRVLEGVPDDIRTVIERLIEKDQSKRYTTADEALSDLKIDVKIVNKGEPEAEPDDAPASIDPERRKRLLLAGAALAASLIVCLVILFLPSGEKPRRKVQAWTILEVDANDRRLKVVEFEGDFAEWKEIPRDAVVKLTKQRAPRPATLEDLRPGDMVRLDYKQEGESSRLYIDAARPIVSRGAEPRVDRQEGVLVVKLTGDRGGEKLSLRIPEKTKFLVLRNLPRKDWETASKSERETLEARHGGDRLGVIGPNDRIVVSHLPDVGRTGRVLTGVVFVYSRTTASGQIEKVEVGKPSRLTFKTTEKQIDLPVHDEAKITLRDSAGNESGLRLSQLAAGDQVTVTYDSEIHEIRVTRSAGRMQGEISSVRPDSKEIFIKPSVGGKDVKLTTNDKTEVSIANEPAKLEELRVYDRVTVLLNKTGSEPVATSIVARRPARADRRVALVGVQKFDSNQISLGVRYAESNVDLLATAMTRRYAVDSAGGRLLRLDKTPTTKQMQEQIADMLKRTNRSVQAIVYVSTHAFVIEGKVYLAGKDFDLKDPAVTGWLLDDLIAALESCPSTDKILMLDISHNWGMLQPPASQPSVDEMLKLVKTPIKTTTVIAANSGNERGAFHKNDNHSVFAYYTAQGFRGAADADRNLRITGAELFAYLQRVMKTAELSSPGTQTPARFGAK